MALRTASIVLQLTHRGYGGTPSTAECGTERYGAMIEMVIDVYRMLNAKGGAKKVLGPTPYALHPTP
eukprot:1581699-Rhodomonas_salina.1